MIWSMTIKTNAMSIDFWKRVMFKRLLDYIGQKACRYFWIPTRLCLKIITFGLTWLLSKVWHAERQAGVALRLVFPFLCKFRMFCFRLLQLLLPDV